MSLHRPHPTLASLLLGLNFRILHTPSETSPDELQITSVTSDSRSVTFGALFVALSGVVNDGHDFLEKAVESGCTALLCESGRVSENRLRALNVVVVEVSDTRLAYAAVAANYYHRPAEKLCCVGITGTNGKTTITYLLEEIFLQNGWNVGVVGTINNRYTLKSGAHKVLDTRFTTPEAFILQQVLREMVDAGVDHVIMEVSSHALDQARIGGITFEAAAFTNLSRDHLDYHPDMSAYLQAKTKLFSEYLKTKGIAVLPVPKDESDSWSWLQPLHDLCKKTEKRIIGWGENERAEVRLKSFQSGIDRTDLEIETPFGVQTLSSPLVGRFNVENILVVFGLCLAMQIDDKLICKALSSAIGAPGRLERIFVGSTWNSRGPVVLVDYAHTPDALEKVLLTAKALPHRELFCVFGCGGDRDTGKRPLMGEVAARLCDVVVVTDDNPRTEDPDKIVAQAITGISPLLGEVKDSRWLELRGQKEHGYVAIRDRRSAIEQAIKAAGQEDIIVIAGKGHEKYQLTLQGKRFFDDRMEAEKALLSWTAELVSLAVCGTLTHGVKGQGMLGSVYTDSRMRNRKGIFVALKGENHDAHDFLEQAVANGASCLVVEHVPVALLGSEASMIIVADTQRALGDMAGFRRKMLSSICDQRIIGITGSCGKTTVKEMAAAILARKWPVGSDYPENCVRKTLGNFNNLIGMPLSLLPLSIDNRAVVLEMGMNRPGELLRLAEIADPDISCITNIHAAHIEGLGSIEGVARAKEELFAATKATATLIVNLDDPWVSQLIGKYQQKKMTFAVRGEKMKTKPDFWASNIFFDTGGAITFTLHYQLLTAAIHLFTAGEHNVANALAAAAIATAAGASLEEIAAGLGDYRPPAKRMEMLRSKFGFTILNDTYNANPASMAAGLKTLKQLAGNIAVAIIGDMRELGETSRPAHFAIGSLIAELKIEHVGIVGEFKNDVKLGALSAGFSPERLRTFADKDGAVAWIKEMVAAKKLGKDDLILVKASRGLRFETIVEKLIDEGA
ncbi:MAG: UDP-N-acetylmuramoyl-L-alanyl-D-glutamate--2,6-diaminopimelate ligase [Proteobacteria bacterium]|nr:UDP-N-acetylmuramoyl-L-alanyl-D-glutamate--2,6-diaminopimelate ligase [Pseudomonadota bacterium]